MSTNRSGAVVLHLTGDLDHEGVVEVENDVRWAVSGATSDVLLDCGDVSFVDSAGLRLIIQAQMMAVDHHHGFAVARPSPAMVRLLEMTGLDELIPIRPE
ncbi:MAG: STAS domain-containing protein [Acidimicrobiales bacterium]